MIEDQIKIDRGEVELQPNQDLESVKLNPYETKFLKIEAYCLPENSTIHCANGAKLKGESGEFYVLVDKIHEFIVPQNIFRKLFIRKIER